MAVPVLPAAAALVLLVVAAWWVPAVSPVLVALAWQVVAVLVPPVAVVLVPPVAAVLLAAVVSPVPLVARAARVLLVAVPLAVAV
ncbi:hypothetical protein, partial [Actinomyces sp. ICM58]|uniref:hypothetical protein n=1 Tax=Actinomyces sp. ICM58 TaxID=1105030 RepID=UPI000587A0C2